MKQLYTETRYLMKSIIQSKRECYVCKTTLGLHKHHVFGASNRKYSEQYKLTVFLCGRHHNLSNESVHFNKELDLHLKTVAQEYYESNYGCRASFIDTFGRNYLD